MRKILIGLVAAAAIAIPFVAATSANAATTVDNGVGFADKSDIQSSSVLDMNNAAFQTAAKAGNIKFTANVDRVIADYEMSCGPAATGATMHRIITQPALMEVKAAPVSNGNKTQILGFNLNGELGAPISVGNATMTETACPAGSFPWMPVSTTQYVKGITGGLQVTNGVKTADLPNTPAPVLVP